MVSKMKLLKIVLMVFLIHSANLFSDEIKWMKNGVISYPGNVEVSPDGKYCALGGGDNTFSTIQVYDIKSASVKISYIQKFNGFLFNKIHFDFSNDSKNFVFPVLPESEDYQICRIVNIENQEVVSELNFSREDFSNDIKINSIYTLKSGKILIILTSFLKSKFVVWDYLNGNIEQSEVITTAEVRFFDINKYVNTIVFLTENNEIITYSAADFSQLNKWTIPTNENDYIHFMDVSDYGSQIAVGFINSGGDAGIKIIDIQSGQLIDTLKEEFFDMKFTNGVCFTKDGKKILYPRNSDYKIVDLDNTKNVSVYPLFGGDKFKIIDENRIISYLTLTVSNGMAYVIDIYTGNLISRLNPFMKDIDFVDFSFDDKYISILMENAFGLLDAETGNVISYKYLDIASHPYWFESSPISYEMIYPAKDFSLVVFDYETGTEIKRLTGHTGIIKSIKYSKDGKQIISVSEDNTVKIWDLESGEIIFDYISAKNPKYAGFTPASNIILIFYTQENFPGMFLLDINSKNIVKSLNIGEIPKINIAYLPTVQSVNNEYFAYGGKKTGIWNVNELTIKNFLNTANCISNTMNLIFSNNNTFISGYCYNTIMIWDLEGNFIKSYDDLPKQINGDGWVLTKSLAVSKNSKYILTSNDYRYLTLWNAPEITSISDEKSLPSDEIYVYPNPSTDFIDINLNKEASLITSDNIQIFDILGLEVGQSSLIDGNNRIDVSHLPAGVYYIKIEDKVEKFLKME